MVKHVHEFRDPIHVFIRVDSDERKVIDSRPFQRLRHIHQLALTYLVYPGATHRRFEHSLGVMELAGRVFDVVMRPDGISDEIREHLPELAADDTRRYWRRVLRMAALCHDMGHLPFSHAAEKELLPTGWNHERFTVELIKSPEMLQIWNGMNPPLRPADLVKIAVGPKELPEQTFSPWETLIAEIVVGDAFGVDRMDYLLRDSYLSLRRRLRQIRSSPPDRHLADPALLARAGQGAGGGNGCGAAVVLPAACARDRARRPAIRGGSGTRPIFHVLAAVFSPCTTDL